MAVIVSKESKSLTSNGISASLAADESRELLAPEGSAAGAGSFATASAVEEALPPTETMAESVTRHVQNPLDGNFQFLLCGIDSLDLGLYVSWNALWEKITLSDLNSLKDRTQGTNGITEQTDLGRTFLFLPGGKPPNYRFHLQFPEYHLFLAKSTHYGTSPNVYVSINAAALWHVELETILELIEYDLSSFGGTVDRIQPSRLDLCADFRMNVGLSFTFLELHRVSRSHKINTIISCPVLETYYCGSVSAPIRLRIYDKGKEIEKSHKQWFRNLWGVDQDAFVWRVEFQLRRPVLKQFRIDSINDLRQKIGSVWEYLTSEWFSLRIHDNVKAERRTIHHWWLDVQNCREQFGDSIGIKRIYSSDTVEPIKNTLAHIMGRLYSVAAHRGINDRKKAIVDLFQLVFDKSSDEKFESEYQKRVIRLGFRGKLGGDSDE